MQALPYTMQMSHRPPKPMHSFGDHVFDNNQVYNDVMTQLVIQVEQYPALYKNTHPAYHHKETTENAWTEISNTMTGLSGIRIRPDDCDTKWKSLRAQYATAKSKWRAKVAADGDETRPFTWPLAKYMVFLEKNVTRPANDIGSISAPFTIDDEPTELDADDRSRTSNCSIVGTSSTPVMTNGESAKPASSRSTGGAVMNQLAVALSETPVKRRRLDEGDKQRADEACDAYAQYIAAVFKSMPHKSYLRLKHQFDKVIAEEEIRLAEDT